jgi:hypothetical protein
VSTAEYDAFGPWIDEVRTPSDVPPLYRDHPLDLAAARLVLKVPRNIARRDALPTMDLYDHLLVVGPHDLTVLSRQDGGYGQFTLGYDRIVAIQDSVNLLAGRLTMHTLADPAWSIPYNGSSYRVVETLVRLLRDLALETIPASGSAPSPGSWPSATAQTPDLGSLEGSDMALVTSCRDLLGGEPAMRLLAAHARRVLAPRGGALTRALHAVRPMTLQGALVLASTKEVQVLHRRDWLVRGNRPVHSLARSVLLLGRLDAVTARQDACYAGVSVVTMCAGTSSIDLPVPSGSVAERVLLGAPTLASA